MKQLLEEYGKVIIAVIAAVVVLSLLFVRYDILGVIGSVADVDTDVSHHQGEGVLDNLIERSKPSADFSVVDTHIYKNYVFRPLDGVVFKDANGEVVEAAVTSILYCDSAGNAKELIDYYNSEHDVIVLNPAHYSSSHTTCLKTEFSTDEDGNLVIADSAVQNLPGVVTVTYKAVDSENQVGYAQMTFVVDGKITS